MEGQEEPRSPDGGQDGGTGGTETPMRRTGGAKTDGGTAPAPDGGTGGTKTGGTDRRNRQMEPRQLEGQLLSQMEGQEAPREEKQTGATEFGAVALCSFCAYAIEFCKEMVEYQMECSVWRLRGVT